MKPTNHWCDFSLAQIRIVDCKGEHSWKIVSISFNFEQSHTEFSCGGSVYAIILTVSTYLFIFLKLQLIYFHLAFFLNSVTAKWAPFPREDFFGHLFPYKKKKIPQSEPSLRNQKRAGGGTYPFKPTATSTIGPSSLTLSHSLNSTQGKAACYVRAHGWC